MTSGAESQQYSYLFDLAKSPRKLWDKRAEIDGLRSVMSLGATEEACERDTNTIREKMLSELGDLTGKSVLEIGTGIGRFTTDLEERASFIASIDMSKRMLDRATTANNKPNYIQAVGQQLPFKDSSFDRVVEVTVLFHVEDIVFRGIIQETLRVLKAGGKALFIDGISSGDSVQLHPYLKYRSIQEYEEAAERQVLNKGAVDVSTGKLHFIELAK